MVFTQILENRLKPEPDLFEIQNRNQKILKPTSSIIQFNLLLKDFMHKDFQPKVHPENVPKLSRRKFQQFLFFKRPILDSV